MKYKDFLLKYGYIFFETFLLSFFCVLTVNNIGSFKINQFALFALSVLSVLLVCFVHDQRKKPLLYIIIFGTAVICTVVVILTKFSVTELFLDMLLWLKSYDKTDETYSFGYAFLFIILVSLIISPLIYLLQRKNITRFIFTLIVFAAMITMGFLEYNAPKAAIFCMAAYILSGIIELILTVYYKPKDKDLTRRSGTFLIPVIIIFSFATAILPSSDKPIQWTFVKNAAKSINTAVTSIVSEIKINIGNINADYSIGMTGYSDNGDVGGSLGDSEKRAMLIQTLNPAAGALYLNGSVMDTYDNNSWKRKASYKWNEDEYVIDSNEFIYAICRSQNLDDIYSLYRARNATIKYDGINTKALFYPSKTSEISSNQKSFHYNANKTGILFFRTKGYPTEYNVSFFEMNVESEKFQKFIISQENYKYKDGTPLNDLSVKHVEPILGDNPEYLLSKRAKEIKADYASIPDNISERVKNLAVDITKDYDGKYEKLKAIEKYLNTNYEYTKMPGEVPEGKELVDYFLFESKEGYCTYFATSMAVMGRCVGIPTRYVQGFSCSNQRIGYNLYEVKNNNAHAWTEAYIEGVGWIPFEPTASFSSQRYKKWTEYESVVYQNQDNDKLAEQAVRKQQNEENKKNSYVFALIGILSLIALSVAGVIIVFAAKVNNARKKYNYYGETQKLMYDFKTIMSFLEILEIKLSDGETLYKFSKRINNIYVSDNVCFERAAGYYMNVKYGGKQALKKETEYINKYKKLVENDIISVKGKLKFRIIKLKLMLR